MTNETYKLKIYKLMNSRFFRNMSWIFILNFTNTIIPYFTFPYITRIFSPEGYGLISFSLAFISYFTTVIDYGFDLTGARLVAINESDNKELSRIFSSILVIKFLFFIVSVVIISIMVNNQKLIVYKEFINVFILVAFSYVIKPTWLFQGLQRMKLITLTSLFIRIAFLVSVFTIIQTKEDILTYSFLYSISFVCIGLISLIIAIKGLKVKFIIVKKKDIFNMLKEGIYIFASSAVIKVMSSTGIFILGLFYAPLYVGYYAGISKITQVITMMFYPIGQALFPHQSKLYDTSFHRGYIFAINVMKKIVPIFFITSVLIIFFRNQIILIFLGKSYLQASSLVLVLSFLPFLSIVSNLMGTQILVASGNLKNYSRAFIRGGTIQIFLYLLLGFYFGMWGVAFAALIGALLNLVLLYIEIKKVKAINYNIEGDSVSLI